MKVKPMAERRDELADAEIPPVPRSEVRLIPSTDRPTAERRRRRRSRRRRAVRGRSICVKRLSRLELQIGRALFPEEPVDRPVTRGDCAHGERPCPFVSCEHHLYLDVLSKTGAIKLNFPDLEVWEMTDSCALDVADQGGTTLDEAGSLMNLTRERIRQLEVKALAKLEALQQMQAYRDHLPQGTSGKRRLPVLATPDDDEEEPG